MSSLTVRKTKFSVAVSLLLWPKGLEEFDWQRASMRVLMLYSGKPKNLHNYFVIFLANTLFFNVRTTNYEYEKSFVITGPSMLRAAVYSC